MNGFHAGPPWVLLEGDEELTNRLARESGLAPTLARLLVNRGVTTSEEAARFLNPSLDHLHHPELLPDLEVGVGRVAQALQRRERIMIYGDYDVDGITSTALLVRTLRALRARVFFRLPMRSEGYDIKPQHVVEASNAGASLILTCDCGVTAHAAADKARELGVDLIITDHHEPGDTLPTAVAVINPKRRDAEYPFSGLAGVGVALKFAQALVKKKLGYDEYAFVGRYLDLAALGTVADVVPMLGENRALVKFGLEAISQSKKVGLQALMGISGMAGKPLTAYSLGYVLGPRINAVGRMDNASLALQLLITRDQSKARALAAELERWNIQRRAEQERVLEEAVRMAEMKDLGACRVIVLVGEGWNPGVIGIVAGRIREIYSRPAVLFSKDAKSGICIGSGRSIPTFDLHQALCSCAHLLERYGGHAQAAGLKIREENLARFDEAINAVAFESIPEEEVLPRLEVEAELSPEEVTAELATALGKLEPFGVGNPEPVFLSRNLTIREMRRVGDGAHLKLELARDGGPPIPCIAFRMGDMAPHVQIGDRVDLCYNLRQDTYNGSRSALLVACAIRRA